MPSFSTPPQPAQSHTPPPPAPQTLAAIPSQDLLGGQKKVQILHHDQVYVLQTTRQGKLILTK
jgi:hemin uptake protein HemP